jgi:hypothetical protein
MIPQPELAHPVLAAIYICTISDHEVHLTLHSDGHVQFPRDLRIFEEVGLGELTNFRAISASSRRWAWGN